MRASVQNSVTQQAEIDRLIQNLVDAVQYHNADLVLKAQEKSRDKFLNSLDKLMSNLDYLDLAVSASRERDKSLEQADAKKLLGNLAYLDLAVSSSHALVESAKSASAETYTLKSAPLFQKATTAKKPVSFFAAKHEQEEATRPNLVEGPKNS